MAVNRRPAGSAYRAVAVFAAAGTDAWGPVQELRGVPSLRLVPTPRHATVLLVAGTVPGEHLEALQRVHDQVPLPRTTIGWRPGGAATEIPYHRTAVDGLDAVVDAIARTASGELPAAVAGARAGIRGSDRGAGRPATGHGDLLPDEDPHEWRGIGPFGQGGEGMMGGTPYGRPMAMTADDRDGLALDRLHLSLGPFLDALPAGLLLDVTLQGELLQEVSPRLPAVGAGRQTPPTPTDAGVHGLRWLSHALHVAGLDALAARAARLATDTTRATTGTDRSRVARRTAWLLWAVARSGIIRGLRGVGHDARTGEDGAMRWRRRLSEIEQGLYRDRLTEPAHMTTPDETRAVLERVLPGMTWADAVSTVVGLDLLGPHLPADVPA